MIFSSARGRPTTVDQALVALNQSLLDLDHVARCKEAEHEQATAAEEEHHRRAVAALTEADRARSVHAKISALVEG